MGQKAFISEIDKPMKIYRSPDDGHRYRPSIFRQIESFGGELHHEERGLAHPHALASVPWAGFEGALSRAVTDFEALRVTGGEPGSDAFRRALESYAALLAQGVAFSDTIWKPVAECFLPVGEEPKIPHVAKDRRHIAMICNKPKHNQNFLTPVTGTADDGRKVLGFSVYEITPKGVQISNREIHSEAEAFSLALEIKRAVTTVFVIGERMADFISSIAVPNSIPAASLSGGDIARVELLRRVCELPSDRFPFERGDVPGIEFSGTEVTIRSSGRFARRLPGQIRMTVSATPQLGALSIKVPL